MTSGVQPRSAGAVLASGLLITGCSRKPAPSTVNAAARWSPAVGAQASWVYSSGRSMHRPGSAVSAALLASAA